MLMMNLPPVDDDDDDAAQENPPPPPPPPASSLPLLFRAADEGQVENVKFILNQGGAMARAVWDTDEEGKTIVQRIQDHPTSNHRQIVSLITAYIDQNPPLPSTEK